MKPEKTSRKTRTIVSGMPMAAVMVVGILAIGTPALAQPTAAPAAQKKSLRRSVLDLLAEARKPRQGEILPDAGAAPKPATEPVPTEPVANPPEQAAPAPETERAGKTAKDAKPVMKPSATDGKNAVPGKPVVVPSDQTASASKSPDTSRAVRATPAIDSKPVLNASGARFVAFDKVKLHVVSQQGNTSLIQWRLADNGTGKPGAWESVAADAEVTERREFRTGVGVSIDLRVEDQAVVTVGPLTRALFERRIRSDGTSLPGVTLARGEITVAESTTIDVVVKTGAESLLVRAGRVSYDGTDAKSK